jgi:hypothetical protein
MPERLRNLARLLPTLEERDFDFGHWAGGETQPDGSIQMPYYEFSPRARELIAALPADPGVNWPDWMKTDEAQALIAEHARIAEASADQLMKLTTSIVRSDRFTEGSIVGAFDSGLITAIARRAAVLTESP